MAVRPGHEAVVRVAVATLWSRPEAVRPVDAPALARHTDIPGWIAGLSAEQRVGDCVLSQLLLGERVLVEEIRPDGWARSIAVEQPAAKLDPRGYPGWLPVDHLAEPDDVTPAPALVGHDRPLWVAADHVTVVPTRPPHPAEVLAVASRLRDVVYLWGGVSTYGIDCSGLVHLAWRRFGVRLPRDADDQAAATTPVDLGAERPGDLYFFARPGRRIHHIGIVTARPGPDGSRRMLHACYVKRRVVEEPMHPDREATLVGAHRVLC